MHPPSAEPDWQEIAGAMVAPPLELTKALRKTLSSVGHLVENFAAACERLRARVDEGLMPELRPWLRPMADDKSCALNGDGLIICPLRMEGGKIHFHSPALPVAHSAT
ncbi:MAG: hypothetical protein WCN98_15175, partial [Verrucomicrobiaceae bacterium]